MPQIGVGGAESQLRALIAGSNPEEATHRVLYYSNSLDHVGLRQYAEAGITPVRLARNRWRPLQFVNRMASQIAAARPDIAHCWLVSGSFWGYLAARRAGVQHVIFAHRSARVSRVAGLRMLERFARGRTWYLANSRAGALSVAGRLRLPLRRFHVIHNGVEVRQFAGPSDHSRICRELGMPEDAKLVICVARLTPAKDHAMLLRVARRCSDSSPVRFLLVGHGELEQDLHHVVKELGMAKIVRFLGLRTDVPRFLRSADLACFTSLWEGFPNSVLEAMAAGLPIVTTRFPGVEELIEDGVHGVTVPCGDDEAAFVAIQTMLRDSKRARSLAAAAKARAQSEFSLEAMIHKTLGYYRSILGVEG